MSEVRIVIERRKKERKEWKRMKGRREKNPDEDECVSEVVYFFKLKSGEEFSQKKKKKS